LTTQKILLTLLLVCSAACISLSGVTLAAAGDWQNLFDGKTLNGWVVRSGQATYKVENGQIVGTTATEGANTFLCTKRDYANFELVLEVKCDPPLNSGIQVRSHALKKDTPQASNPKRIRPAGTVYGYQVEISANGNAGRIWDEARHTKWHDPEPSAEAKKAYKPGQWNLYRIVAQGEHIRTWVNGTPVADINDGEDAAGLIGLQVHRIKPGAGPYQVRWRNIRIRELPIESHSADIKIFSGQPRLLIVHGYSTSAHWWAFLQHKIDRYMRGPNKRAVEVRLVNKGGTPIAKWMNIETGEPSPAWKQMFTPVIQAERSKRPVIVLAQQSLQGVYGERVAGIRNKKDRERIKRGSDVIEQYGKRILDDGAAAAIIAMHIYKITMEPEIGNERLALAELMRHEPAGIFAGPDVWTPTSKQHPLAFDTDKVHPNYIGAEIMAHYWFKSLLEREGLEVPDWSRQEMEDAIKNKPLGLTRTREAFQGLLEKWRITSRRPSAPPNRSRAPASGGRKVPQRVLDRYDKDGDGKLSEAERAEFMRARQQRQR
jgi:hypothetical protein